MNVAECLCMFMRPVCLSVKSCTQDPVNVFSPFHVDELPPQLYGV